MPTGAEPKLPGGSRGGGRLPGVSTERLSIFDAIFYYTDNRRVAMQVSAGILVDGPIDFERYRAWLAPRIDRMPKLRMTLKPAPFALRLPAWTPDPDFDLDWHVQSHTLPSPGDDNQLRALFTELIHRRLPHDRPMWRLHVINGREHGRSALLSTSHHCIADAEGVMEMFNVFLESAPLGDAPAARASTGGRARETHTLRPLHGMRSLMSRDGRRRLTELARYMRTRAPRFPFTRPVSGRVNIAWRQIDLDTIRRPAKAFGATATDVILAAAGAAMDSYAEKHGVAVNGKRLLLQVPANVRLPNKYGQLGNELAMLPGVVPLGIADPVERLQRVAAYNRKLKELDMAPLIHGLMDRSFRMATPPGQALLCRTMVSKPYLHAARVLGLPPREHGLVSSVVMPRVKYAVDGQPVTGFINIMASQFNFGFGLSPVTYDGRVTFGLSVDAKHFGASPDGVLQEVVSGINALSNLA